MNPQKLFLSLLLLTPLVFLHPGHSVDSIPPSPLWKQVFLAQEDTLPTQRYITMYHLNVLGEISPEANNTCTFMDTSFGCAELGSDGYPYQDNPVWVDVENDYLLDVLPREMNVAENTPTLAAFHAQDLAARALADTQNPGGGSIFLISTMRTTSNLHLSLPTKHR